MSLDKSWTEKGKEEYDNEMSSMAQATVGPWAFAYGAACFQDNIALHFLKLAEEFGTTYADITINEVLEAIEDLKA